MQKKPIEILFLNHLAKSGQILTVYIHGRGRIALPDNTNREPTIEIEKIYSIEKSDPPIHLREALLLDLPSPR